MLALLLVSCDVHHSLGEKNSCIYEYQIDRRTGSTVIIPQEFTPIISVWTTLAKSSYWTSLYMYLYGASRFPHHVTFHITASFLSFSPRLSNFPSTLHISHFSMATGHQGTIPDGTPVSDALMMSHTEHSKVV